MELVTGSQIYWLTRCDGLREILGWSQPSILVFVVSLALALALYCMQLFGDNAFSGDLFGDKTDDEMETAKAKMRRVARTMLIVGAVDMALCVCGTTLRAFIPTTKEMAAIIVIPRVANAQSVQDIGSGIVELAKDWMQELHPKKRVFPHQQKDKP